MAIKQKAHIILGTVNQQTTLTDLNKDLANGWKIIQVHQGNGGGSSNNYWLVVIQERLAGSGGDDE